MPQVSFEDYKDSVQEKIRQLNERIDAIGDKRSAETVRLKKQRASYEQRLRIKSEEQDRKFKIARREKQIKLVLTAIKLSVAQDVFQAISDDLRERLPSLDLDKMLA